MEGILEAILGLMARYPIAFLRWMFTGFKKGKLKKYLEMDGLLSLFLLSALILIIVFIVRYFRIL